MSCADVFSFCNNVTTVTPIPITVIHIPIRYTVYHRHTPTDSSYCRIPVLPRLYGTLALRFFRRGCRLNVKRSLEKIVRVNRIFFLVLFRSSSRGKLSFSLHRYQSTTKLSSLFGLSAIRSLPTSVQRSVGFTHRSTFIEVNFMDTRLVVSYAKIFRPCGWLIAQRVN